MGRPLYELIINDEDETGVTAIALVDAPAIQINWQAFEQQKPYKFETVNEEQRIIAGPLMVADMPIFRNDERGEYDVFFKKGTISKIIDKFHRNEYSKNVNPMHDSMMLLPDIYMISDFQIDSARGINTPKGYPTLTDGSWFGQFKVRNDEVWNEYIKTGIFKGFSVEGFFNEHPVQSEDLTAQEIDMIINNFS